MLLLYGTLLAAPLIFEAFISAIWLAFGAFLLFLLELKGRGGGKLRGPFFTVNALKVQKNENFLLFNIAGCCLL
jgi:hypothetical protein